MPALEVLILTFCASVTMDNCKVSRLTEKPVTHEQCEAQKELNTAILGTGPDQNYRLECKPAS